MAANMNGTVGYRVGVRLAGEKTKALAPKTKCQPLGNKPEYGVERRGSRSVWWPGCSLSTEVLFGVT
jgi:hypothetical protein